MLSPDVIVKVPLRDDEHMNGHLKGLASSNAITTSSS